MKKKRKVKITIVLEHTIIDDWYDGERKPPKQKLKEYEESFGDIEVLENHILSKLKYGWDVKAEYVEQ